MICFHKYKIILEKVITVDVRSYMLNREWEEDCLLKIYQCEKCKKMKGIKIIQDGIKLKLNEMELYQIKNILKV